ncbi:MAG: hypothetical protein NVS3B26_24080 [Mycobacteriales bacterium]
MNEVSAAGRRDRRQSRSRGRRVWLAVGLLSVTFNVLMGIRATGVGAYGNLALAGLWAVATVWWDRRLGRRQLRHAVHG